MSRRKPLYLEDRQRLDIVERFAEEAARCEGALARVRSLVTDDEERRRCITIWQTSLDKALEVIRAVELSREGAERALLQARRSCLSPPEARP